MTRRILVTMLVLGTVAYACAAGGAAGGLTRAQYQAMLHSANAAVTSVETAAQKGLTAKATHAQAKALLLAWANTETRLGKSFRAVSPPRNAVRANALLSQGEITFGSELAYVANHLPQNKAKAGAFIEQRLGNTKGARKIDAALALLKKAGYPAG
ncbi:MAG TPA: hypothetical protein VLK53_02240 [Gaiellaceae bacterium]|nr:hypothetical protein [Gaiellaceae bacterium]